MQVSLGTVNKDLSCLRQQAQQNLQKHIQNKLPEEYQRCLTGINQVLKLSWQIANRSKSSNNNDNGDNSLTITDDKTRLQALALANDCYKYIFVIITLLFGQQTLYHIPKGMKRGILENLDLRNLDKQELHWYAHNVI